MKQDHDIYALYVRSYRTSGMTWIGPEPIDAPGQLAIAFGKSDGRLGGVALKTRAELVRAIAKHNSPSTPCGSRIQRCR